MKQLMRSGYVNVSWDVLGTGGYPIQEFVLHAYPPTDYFLAGNDDGSKLLESKHMGTARIRRSMTHLCLSTRSSTSARSRAGQGETILASSSKLMHQHIHLIRSTFVCLAVLICAAQLRNSGRNHQQNKPERLRCSEAERPFPK